ncbi:MAG: hypothetical protein IJR89_00735 [Clostridia bacterium]|nr:hypothetical protein [Clostridia bacterium]
MKKICYLLSLLLVLTLLVPLAAAPAAAADDVCFISDNGSDLSDGSSPEKAKASLNAAYAALPNGGMIVICGPLTLSRSADGSDYRTPETATGAYTLTSVWNGTDYRTTAEAALLSDMWLYFNSAHTLDHLKIRVQKSTSLYCCNGNKVVIGEDVECVKDGSSNYIGITAGRNDDAAQDAAHGGDLTINGGSWQMIRGGTRNNQKLNCVNEGSVSVTINGGEINAEVFAAGDGTIKGDVLLTINGGTFKKSIRVLGTGTVEGNATVVINGGDFIDTTEITGAVAGSGSIKGTAVLKINGGTFAKKGMIVTGDVGEHEKFSQGITLDASAWETPNADLLTKATGFDQVLYDASKVPVETEAPETAAPETAAPGETDAAETQATVETKPAETQAAETKAPAETAAETTPASSGSGSSSVPVYAIILLIVSLCGCVASAILFFRCRSANEN